jgi:uncharacterized membrane protein HdeD (DUF308 family)
MADDRRSAMAVLRGSRILAYTVGVITLGAGIILLFWPEATVRVVAIIIGVLMAAAGIGELLEGVSARDKGSYWGLLVVRGVINLAIGVALVFWPGVTVSVIVWLFGIAVIAGGLIGLIASFQIPKEHGRSGYLTRALVSLLIGLVIVVWPDATVRVLTLVVGLGLALWGLVLLWSGYQLSKADVEIIE